MDALVGILKRIGDEKVSADEKIQLVYKAVSFADRTYADGLSSEAMGIFLDAAVQGLVHPTRTMRGATLRLIRYYLCAKSEGLVVQLNESRVPLLIARSIERYDGLHHERMQAIKLVRRMVELTPQHVSHAVVAALVAVAEHPKEAYAMLALETLGELTLANPRVSVDCGVIRTLLQAAVEPGYEALQKSLVTTVVVLYDDPKTRVYVRPQADWRILFAPLTDNIPEPGVDKAALWKSASRAISEVCCTWTGLLALLADHVCIPSLVQALHLRQVDLQQTVLNCFFDILKLRSMSLSDPLRAIRREARLTVSEASTLTSSTVDLPSRSLMERPNLLDSYLAIVLVALVDAGIIDALVEVSRANEDQPLYRNTPESMDLPQALRMLSLKAVALLGEVLNLSNSLLPTIHCARLQTLPSLMKYAISFRQNAESRSNASSMVWFLHQYAHYKGTAGMGHSSMVTALTGANKWRRIKGKDRRLDRIDDVKHMMDTAMDEKQFQTKMQDTLVLITKDYTKWNWDAISEVIEGPLHNVTHLLFALTRCKFAKRLLSFLRPSKRLFSQLSYSPQNATYIRVSCQLIELLMQSDHGASYLQENVLLKELAELLQNELSASGVHTPASSSGWASAQLAGGSTSNLLSAGGASSSSSSLLADRSGGSGGRNASSTNESPSSGGAHSSFIGLRGVGGGGGSGGPNSSATAGTPSSASSVSADRGPSDRGGGGSGSGGAGSGNSGTLGGGAAGSSTLASLASPLAGGNAGVSSNSTGAGAVREAFFSAQRVLKTMTREYFSIIGTLSAFQRGLQLLKVYKILTYLRPLMEIPGRDDLSNIILTSLDYNLGGAQSPRLLLLSCLQSQSRVVRFLATRHMRVLLRSNTTSFSQWGVDFLIKQLNLDTDAKVRQLALSILDEACDEVDCMETLIEQRASDRPLREVLPELGKSGKDLLIRLLSRPSGFKMLSESSFIQAELEYWRDVGNVAYVQSLEEGFERAFSASTWKKEAKADVGNGILFTPPHFFGELAKTEMGSQLLRSSGIIEQVLKRDLYSTNNPPLQRKAALWVVGNVGASETGLELLREFKVIDYVVKEARTCSVLSVRGTCFYVLGMLSRTEEGRARLNQLAWESPDNNGSVCIPSRVRESNIFRIRSYDYYGDRWPKRACVRLLARYDDPQCEEVLKLVENLGSHITTESASKSLKKLAQANAPPLADPAVFVDAMQIIATFRYRLPIRRFIYDAFAAAGLDASFFRSLPLDKDSPLSSA